MQKLSERKVSRFTEFHPNAGKFLQFYFICTESAAIAQSICRENFHDSLKIHENRKAFLSYNFCHLRHFYKRVFSFKVQKFSQIL